MARRSLQRSVLWLLPLLRAFAPAVFISTVLGSRDAESLHAIKASASLSAGQRTVFIQVARTVVQSESSSERLAASQDRSSRSAVAIQKVCLR